MGCRSSFLNRSACLSAGLAAQRLKAMVRRSAPPAIAARPVSVAAAIAEDSADQAADEAGEEQAGEVADGRKTPAKCDPAGHE